MNLKYEEITREIIGSAFEVYNILGYGFLEKVYQKAMQVEIQNRNLTAVLEPHLKVKYKGVIVGDYYADIFVDAKIIVEIKAHESYVKKDEAQLLNELKGIDNEIGLLINFGSKTVEYKRMILTEKEKNPRLICV